MPKSDMSPAEQKATDMALKRIGDCIRRRGTVLDLSGLSLTRLPPKIVQLGKLTELDLASNCLETLPPEVLGFSNLTRLNLSNNPLGMLPPEIGQLAGLTRLDLNHTPLDALPPEIGMLTGLTRLYLTHNRLQNLPPETGQLAKLTRLYLSHNALVAFPPELTELPRLTRLDLSHNRLKSLPTEIVRLEKLSVLDLSHNPLVSLPLEICQLARLAVLHLAHTQLAELPPEIGQLTNLTELDLGGNSLAALPESLGELENLERLFLHDNPALLLSPCILGPDARNGHDAKYPAAKSILDFLFNRQSGKTRPLNEVKLILLGRCGAGKTTIVQALRDLPYHEFETRTAGIALCDWSMEHAGEPAVTAHVWDFSGDPDAHILHPAFFSPQSLYLVVLSGREQHEHDDAEYWLRMIRDSAADAQGQGPPVIVALNQWNVPGCRPEVDRSALRERYPFIRGFVEMDCKGKKGIPSLKTALFRELERMPWVHEPFPDEWNTVRHALTGGQAHITASEFRELCIEHGVKDEGQQKYLLEFLVHLGTVLNHPDDSVVTLPEWLIRNLYPLLHGAEKQSGILTQADVEMILPRENDEAERERLMTVLERLGIAVAGQSASGGVWLFPHAQPDAPSAGIDDFNGVAIRLRYIYQTFPENLVAKIIVRRHDFIEEQGERKQQWRHGVILARKRARARIIMDPLLRELAITVTGPFKTRHQLADLCQAEILELHAGYPGLEFTEEPRVRVE